MIPAFRALKQEENLRIYTESLSSLGYRMLFQMTKIADSSWGPESPAVLQFFITLYGQWVQNCRVGRRSWDMGEGHDVLLKPLLGRGLVPEPHFTVMTLGGGCNSPGTQEEWKGSEGCLK